MQFNWNAYINIPYVENGRSKDGADCWGLVRLVYQNEFGITLPALSEVYAADDRGAAVEESLALHKESWVKREGTPKTGDVVLFRIMGEPVHVGIALSEGSFLHVRRNGYAVIERLTSGVWKHRVEGFYYYSDEKVPAAATAVIQPNPLKTERIDLAIAAGRSIQEIHNTISCKAAVPYRAVILLNSVRVPEIEWASTYVEEGDRLEYRAVAGDSKTVNTLLTIGLIIAAPYAAPYLVGAVGSTLLTSATVVLINYAGRALINQIAPAGGQMVETKAPAPVAGIRQAMLQGGNNQANSYGAIPVVLGQVRYTAPLGAASYVEADAESTYLRMLLVWGYGPLQVTDLRVGEASVSTLVGIQVETYLGDSPSLPSSILELYGQDIKQESVGLELPRTLVEAVSAVRTANVLVITTSAPHTFSVGMDLRLAASNNSWRDAAPIVAGGTITAITTSTVSIASVGVDGPLGWSYYWVDAANWVSRVIQQDVDSISVNLHFPEGLRSLNISGIDIDGLGKVADFTARAMVNIQIRQLDSNTLAPITGWGDISTKIVAKTISLPRAWFNTNDDSQLEPVYIWVRVSVDAYSKVVVRTGAPTSSPYSEPSGTILTRLQNSSFGLNTVYTRLPDLGSGEEELYQICIYGNTVYTTIDNRASAGLGVTGCSMVISGLSASLSAGSISRADSTAVDLSYNKKDAFNHNVNFTVAHGTYEVRAIRVNSDNADRTFSEGSAYKKLSKVALVSITGYANNRPVNPPKPLAMTSIRVKASDQLNGNIDGISALVTTVCKDYDYITDSWVTRATRNPASLIRYVLQHPANAQACADEALDIPSFKDFHNYCRINQFMFDSVITDQRSLLEIARSIAAAGRASPSIRDGKWFIIVDKPRSVLSQVFTPHNSWGFESSRAMYKFPHGFRVAFTNSERGYQADEMIVYADGYTPANATLFESLELPGVTTKAAIFKHARFHLAQLKLRPETYSINVDAESLISTRGDLVRVTHDVPMWGIGSGRIKSVDSNTVVSLTEEVPLVAATQYTMRIRLATGAYITRTVATVPSDGYYSQVTFTTSIAGAGVAEDDLFMFGSLNSESAELIILSVEPIENNCAKLTLVDYSPDVYLADVETIPPFNSQITQPPLLQAKKITVSPSITGLISDERAMSLTSTGQYSYHILVGITNPAGVPSTCRWVESQITDITSVPLSWRNGPTVAYSAGAISIADVNESNSYYVRVRYVTEAGSFGPWASSAAHKVVGKTTPPSAPTGLAASISLQGIRLTWLKNPEIDVVSYEIRTADSGWGDSSYLWRGSSFSATVPAVLPGTLGTWYIKAIDAAGLYSASAATQSLAIPVVTPVAGATSSFYDTSTTSASVTLSWTDVTPAYGLGGYSVTYTDVDLSVVTKTVKANTITLPANWIGSRTFSIYTVDVLGNLSAAFTKVVQKYLPSPVTNFRARVVDNNVLLYWDLPNITTLPIDHVIIKKGASWDTATLIGTKAGGFTSLQELIGGNFTYWCATVDTDNNVSVPASIAAAVSEPPDFVFNFSIDSLFTGTLYSAKKIPEGVILPIDITKTWQSHFTTNGWASPAAQVAAGYPRFIQPTTGSGYYQEVFDTGAILSSSKVSISFTGTQISGTPAVTCKIETSPDGASWYVNDGVTEAFATNFRYIRITITVSGAADLVYILNTLSCVVAAKLKNDAGTVACVASDTLGTIVNFNVDYIDVSAINLSAAGVDPLSTVFDFNDTVITGTYTVSNGILTVNANAHNLLPGQAVKVMPSTGTAPLAVVTVAAVANANQYTAAVPWANTSGNLRSYSQSMRVYSFNSTTGARVSGNVSWSIKGY